MLIKTLRIINILEVIVLVLLLSFSTTKIITGNEENTETQEITRELNTLKDPQNVTPSIKELKKKNKDTIGWIKVNNTNIDYPFVQSKDNNYYLTHNFNKKKTSAGWIFLDKRNNNNLSDKNNIIYGHSRKDKSMFGTLKDTIKSKWYENKDNHIIKITTETKEYSYKTFSIYTIEKENYYLQTDFTTEKEYMIFLNILKERSIYEFKVNLENTASILTLSTCYKDNKRVVMHAKLIN